MKSNKIILYLLLGVLLVIFVYNFILPQAFSNYNSGIQMGMGMHMSEYRNSNNSLNYYIYLAYIIFTFILIIVGVLIINYMLSNISNNRCKKCGVKIESEAWKICPRCGTQLSNRKDDKK